jgi:hypothetical protein
MSREEYTPLLLPERVNLKSQATIKHFKGKSTIGGILGRIKIALFLEKMVN